MYGPNTRIVSQAPDTWYGTYTCIFICAALLHFAQLFCPVHCDSDKPVGLHVYTKRNKSTAQDSLQDTQ